MPEFYGVEKKIKAIVEESGDVAVLIENKSLAFDYKCRSAKLKLLRKIYYLLFSPREQYIKKELKRLTDLKFDVLFSINCNVTCSYLFKKLKSHNSKLYSILFLWDTLGRYAWEEELTRFDRVLTFERQDAEKYNIEYKPNFYLEQKTIENRQSYDLFFAGKFSPERLRILDSIISQKETWRISYNFNLWPSYKIFLHNYLIYYILKKIRIKNNWTKTYITNYEAVEMKLGRDYIIKNSIRYEESQLPLYSSNVILDIPFKGQTGLTHRVIEALAAGKKIVTTNASIRNESFYDPDQIKIIDSELPDFDYQWMKERKVFPVDKNIEEQELHRWFNSMIDTRVA
jgi:hypothetical protein